MQQLVQALVGNYIVKNVS